MEADRGRHGPGPGVVGQRTCAGWRASPACSAASSAAGGERGARRGARELPRGAGRAQGNGRPVALGGARGRAARDRQRAASQDGGPRVLAGEPLGRGEAGRAAGVARAAIGAGPVAARGHHLRAGHRLDRRHPGGRAGHAAHPAAVPRPVPPGAGVGRPDGRRPSARAAVGPGAAGPADTHDVVRRVRRDLGQQRHARRPRRAGVRADRPGYPRLLPAAGRGAGGGPAVRARGRRRGLPHDPVGPQPVAATLRRRSGSGRPHDHRQRTAGDGGGRAAGLLPPDAPAGRGHARHDRGLPAAGAAPRRGAAGPALPAGPGTHAAGRRARPGAPGRRPRRRAARAGDPGPEPPRGSRRCRWRRTT